jgi:toxin-antitoxin system PIN domain toxin
VIAVDTNILVYAHREEAPFHAVATRRLSKLADGPAPWAIPWPCVHEFLGVVTHPRVYRQPTSLSLAIEAVDEWLKTPTLLLFADADEYLPLLRSTLIAGKITGPRVDDAHIAALFRQHGLRELWSADRDFGRFPDLKVVNPLTGQD